MQIEVDWDDEQLVITFVDNGHIFDPGMVAPPNLDSLPEHGMGLFIMRSCMDQVDYRPGPPNVLRLVKLRGHREAGLPPPPSSGKAITMAPPSPGLRVSGPHPKRMPRLSASRCSSTAVSGGLGAEPPSWTAVSGGLGAEPPSWTAVSGGLGAEPPSWPAVSGGLGAEPPSSRATAAPVWI